VVIMTMFMLILLTIIIFRFIFFVRPECFTKRSVVKCIEGCGNPESNK
jgi:hypothetical protein